MRHAKKQGSMDHQTSERKQSVETVFEEAHKLDILDKIFVSYLNTLDTKVLKN